MAGSDIKELLIVGARSKDFKVKRRRTRRLEGGGDDDMASPHMITKVQVPPSPMITKVEVPPPVAPPPAAAAAKMSNIPPAPALQSGGASDTKVILKSKVKRTAKVLLKKKEAPGHTTVAAQAPTTPLKVKTRKVILKSLNKRLKKTRHAVKQAQLLPIQQVRAVLVDKGLVKATSKAPESILRQIYSDSLIVAKKTL